MRGGSGAVPRTASQLPRQPTLDKGHIRASSHMQRTSSMPASYGSFGTLQLCVKYFQEPFTILYQ